MAKQILCPIDNKNLLEDAFDEIIEDLFEAPDHYKGDHRHKIGTLQLKDGDGILICEACVDVSWRFGDNAVEIQILAFNEHVNDLEETKQAVFSYYARYFKEWENEANEGLRVEYGEMYNSVPTLRVWFYHAVED